MGDGSAGASGPGAGGTRAAAGQGPRGRISAADLMAFRRSLDGATRRAVVTPLIVLACGAYFAAMIAAGVPIRWPSAAELVDWGANDGARVILRHEYGRLIASVFVHGGIVHLAVNMWSLLMIGPLVERIYGHLAFAVIYLAAGVGGAITSAAVPPVRISVGASGAICGVLGGLLAFLLVHRRAIPPTVLRQLSKSVLMVVLFMAVLGAVVSNIDQAAHLGGLAIGFLCGLLLIGPWPVAHGPRRRLLVRRVALSAAVAAGLAGGAMAVAQRGDAVILPGRRLDDLTEQLAPVVREFQAIRKDLAQAVGDEMRLDPWGQRALLVAMQALRGRVIANASRLDGIRPSDPELGAIRESLSRALAGQGARIEALSRYVETGDRAALDAAREALAATIEATHECEELRLAYLNRHGLNVTDTPGGRPR